MCSAIGWACTPEALVSTKGAAAASGARSSQSVPALHCWSQRSRGARAMASRGSQPAATSTSSRWALISAGSSVRSTV